MTEIALLAQSPRALITYEDKKVLRDKIADLQSEVEKLPQTLPPIKHTFSKNVYAREMTMAAGTMIIGKIHKHQNLNIISKGKVSFFSVDGAVHAEAPCTFVSTPGVKRVIFAHEETVWTTIHGTGETDLAKIEDEFIAKDYDEVYLATDRSLDSVLTVLGFTREQLTAISENELDQIPFRGRYPVFTKPSLIHGLGLFSLKHLAAGDYICPARFDGKRTPAGRYMNHSGQPNAEVVLRTTGDVNVYALKDIAPDEEILTDYYFNFTNTREPSCHGL